MQVARGIVERDAAVRDVTAVFDWRRQLAARELVGRQLIALDALAAGWPDRRSAAIDMQLKLIQLQTRSGAALAAAEGLVRRSLGPADGAAPRKLPAELAPFEFQLNIGGALRRVAAWGETLPQRDDGRLMAEIRAGYLLTSYALPEIVDQLAPRTPGLRELVYPAPVSLARLQARLGPGEVAVIAYPMLTHTVVVAISQHDVLTRLVPVNAARATALVTQLRASIGAFEHNANAPYAADAARALYAATLGPAAPLLSKARSVIWIGFGAYGALPPAILMDGPSYAIERYRFTVLTSLEELAGLGRTPSGQATSRFVGIGGAELDAADLMGQAQSLDDAPDLSGGMRAVQGAELVKLYRMPEFLRTAENDFGGGALLIGREAATEGRLSRGHGAGGRRAGVRQSWPARQ